MLATYDDHDFAWNNGYGRMQGKYNFKQIFLDGVGEPEASPRRNRGRGIEWKYTLNAGQAGKEVDVLLLDERYNRDALPCKARGPWCEGGYGTADDPRPPVDNPSHSYYAWCNDYIRGRADGGVLPPGDVASRGDLTAWGIRDPAGGARGGACCKRDDAWAEWCGRAANQALPEWSAACDPNDPEYGRTVYRIGDPAYNKFEEKGKLYPGTRWAESPATAPFCDMLGQTQWRWLEEALAGSSAPLKLVVSGSVLFSNPLRVNPCSGSEFNASVSDANKCVGSGDDWDSYPNAQRKLINLLHRTSGPGKGCAVVLTGDFHFSDIKAVRAGAGTAYAPFYGSDAWGAAGAPGKDGTGSHPLFQVMASGMTTSTNSKKPCDPSKPDSEGRPFQQKWTRDPADLRGPKYGECDFVRGEASFGMVDVDWDARVASLQLRSGKKGSGGKVLYEYRISLDTCEQVD